MLFKKRIRCFPGLIATLCLLSIISCIPYSDNPLTPPDPEKLDTTLFGTWYWTEDQETGFVHMGKDKDSGLLKVVMIEWSKDGELKLSTFSGHTSSLDKNNYLNLKWVAPETENKGWFFVKYQRKPDSLVISLMREEPVEKAIAEGLIKGSAENGKSFSSPRISSESATLRKFFTEKDADLFQESNSLKRLKIGAGNF